MASPYREPAELDPGHPVPMPRVGVIVLLGVERWPARIVSADPFVAQVCGGVAYVEIACEDCGTAWCYPHPEAEVPTVARKRPSLCG